MLEQSPANDLHQPLAGLEHRKIITNRRELEHCRSKRESPANLCVPLSLRLLLYFHSRIGSKSVEFDSIRPKWPFRELLPIPSRFNYRIGRYECKGRYSNLWPQKTNNLEKEKVSKVKWSQSFNNMNWSQYYMMP